MNTLFDITGKDIEKLTEEDLRTLVALLSEADHSESSHSPRQILWGGHQKAADGGIDVLINHSSLSSNSFIPRATTGFQVKASEFKPSQIVSEMMPKGVLREEILKIIKMKGAYIIVSSKSSVSLTALKKRIDAMRECIHNILGTNECFLDFYDQNRIASWVRIHPSMIIWVRNKIGRNLSGWQPYGDWSNCPTGLNEEYIIDNTLRVFHDSKQDPTTIEQGLTNIRKQLLGTRNSIRLVGLSGLGKTRFVQALFDSRIGDNSLDPSGVFYTDFSDEPNPSPRELAEYFISTKTKGILVVDNCAPDLHRNLTRLCTNPASEISIITIEYDVREDLPEETTVFRLAPSSDETIEKLIRKRFPYIGNKLAWRIAENSGGNARLGLVLAGTVEKGENPALLKDEVLFERLFKQRGESNEGLHISAMSLALVYSFNGLDTISNESELKLLGTLFNKTVDELYRDIESLKEKGLVQFRNKWRAILPHAIANRLADQALKRLSFEKVCNIFLNNGSERIITSFTRRLSYLHNSIEARKIAEEWLSPQGFLGKTDGDFNSFGINLFKNLTPLAPEIALSAIERFEQKEGFATRKTDHFYEYCRILLYIAYDSNLFLRCSRVLVQFALSEKIDENSHSIRTLIKPLFHIILSGTHAPVEYKITIIEELLLSKETSRVHLGLTLLDELLSTDTFFSGHEYEVGAEPRDYGFHPKSQMEVVHWYQEGINFCAKLSLSGSSIADDVRKILSNNLRGLCSIFGLYKSIEQTCIKLHKDKPWNEGCLAIRSVLRWDSKKIDSQTLSHLRKLDNRLQPKNLYQKARMYAVVVNHSFHLEDDVEDIDDIETNWKKVEKATYKIGIQVTKNKKLLNILLPELISSQNERIGYFGRGIAQGTNDLRLMWKRMLLQFSHSGVEGNIGLMSGFLAECVTIDYQIYNEILDEIVEDDLVGELYPYFQTTFTIDQIGINRLHSALDKGKAKIHCYKTLAWGRAHETISDDDLSDILEKILLKQDGFLVVIEILQMRYIGHENKTLELSDKLLQTSCKLLSLISFPYNRSFNRHEDYKLAQIAAVCFKSSFGKKAAQTVSRNLSDAMTNNAFIAFDFNEMTNNIAKYQPEVFLDIFIGKNIKKGFERRLFTDHIRSRPNPVNNISDSELTEWCMKSPTDRIQKVITRIDLFNRNEETKVLSWKPLVMQILDISENIDPILVEMYESLHPRSWSGSLAAILSERQKLFVDLYEHARQEVQTWAKASHRRFQEIISEDIERDRAEEILFSQTFE